MHVLSDFSTNVHRALGEIDPKYMEYPGIVICGTHTPHDVEKYINSISVCRKTKIPYLGICFGYQLAAIEYARNVRGIKDATSQEFGEGFYAVSKLPEPRIGLREGESYWQYYGVTIDFQVPDHFFISQFHPEYQSRKNKPHLLLVDFLEYAKMAV